MAADPSLSKEDRSRFEHMRKAARDAIAVLGTFDLDGLRRDMVRTRALVNCFTEIGEAAARVTNEGRQTASDVPWQQIVGMRHILVHVYWASTSSSWLRQSTRICPRSLRRSTALSVLR